MKKLLVALLIGLGIYGYIDRIPRFASSSVEEATTGAHSIASAYENRLSGVQVAGSGNVIRLLADDNEGSRHQKFLIRLSSGQTVLITHSIDLAARINSLREGDTVDFFGEYEWNSKGGLVHWTHHDPNGYHQGGWLKHKGQVYE